MGVDLRTGVAARRGVRFEKSRKCALPSVDCTPMPHEAMRCVQMGTMMSAA